MLLLFAFLFCYVIAIQLKASIAIKMLIAIAIPVAVSTTIEYIGISGNNLPLSNLFSLQDGIVLLLQAIVAYTVFLALDRKEDDFAAWFSISVLGGFVIYILIPYLVGLMKPLL